MSHEIITPGTAQLAEINLDPRIVRRAARVAQFTVRKNIFRESNTPFISDNTYAGRYISEHDQRAVPPHLVPIVSELDQLFPNDLRETSVLRGRFRSRRSNEPMHPDDVKDYRTITILRGEGVFMTHDGPAEIGHDGIIEGSSGIPYRAGTVIILNNLVNQKNLRLWHRTQGGALMLVYGKYERRGLTWQS